MLDRTGKFVVIDGIAGSGKSTLIKAATFWAEQRDYKIFDLLEWTKENRNPPTFDQVADHDIFFTFEPTKTWIGAAIRYELARTDKPYSGLVSAQAFSLDRLIMYNRLIIPALQAGKKIIQDRSVSTSIAYQPAMDDSIKQDELLKLPGNALAMKHAPDLLVLTDLEPEDIADRINNRNDDNKGVYQDVEFMKKISERYRAEWYSQLFLDHGSSVHTFDTRVTKQTMTINFIKLLETIF
jgi:thymidylate kinase